MDEILHGQGQLYPAVLVFYRESVVEVFPIIIEAVSKAEAHGKAHEIGLKVNLNMPGEGWQMVVKTGASQIIEVESVVLNGN